MNQSGIKLPQDVIDTFQEARASNNVRWIKIEIINESLKITAQSPLSSTLENEFDSLKSAVVENASSYFVVRLDSKRSEEKGFDWLLILYVPDGSKVKQKMLMSSTADTIKSNLGNQYFLGTYHCTVPDELTFVEFKKGWVPKSEAYKYAEELRNEKERMNEEEKSLGAYHDGPSKANVKGLSLPVDDEVGQKLDEFYLGNIQFVSLQIVGETIKVHVALENVNVDEIKDNVGPNDARFMFYRFSHEFNDDTVHSILMIYVCPGTAKVKERMIYSSTKSSIGSLATEHSINVEKNIELSEISDLTYEFLHNYLHASVTAPKESFSKPKKPLRKK